jgi:hypothetical protein
MNKQLESLNNHELKVQAFITKYGFTRFVNAINDGYLLAYNYQQLIELWALVSHAIALHHRTFGMDEDKLTMRELLKLHSAIGTDIEEGNLA